MNKTIFSSMTLQKKILYSLYAVLFTVIVVSSILVIWLQYRADKSKTIQLYQRFSQTSCRDMDYLLQDVLDIGIYFAVNNDIEKVLNSSEDLVYDSTLFWKEETPLEFLQEILAIKSHIKNVILYPENGKSPFYISRDASVFDASIKDIRATDIYQKSIEARGNVVWEKVTKGANLPFMKNMNDKIVAHRELFDLSKKKRLGHAVIAISAASFEEICEEMLQSSSEMALVLDSEGVEFLATDEVPQEVRSMIEELNLNGLSSSAVPDLLETADFYIFPSKSEQTNITVCYISPKSNWRRIMQTGSLFLPVMLLLVLLIVFYPLSALISIQLTRPLERLTDSMEKFKKGDFNQHIEVTSDDEIGQLSQTFNRMVTDIHELIEKNYVMTLREKEMELNTLQSQINPHFLYNVLDSLYWQAIDQDNEKLGEDILTLSKLFRMVLSEGRSEISVNWEIELVTCYLQIQKMRFAKRLNYEIDVDPDIGEYRISKLLLQPFVENAVIHGLEMQKVGGMIRIRGFREDTHLFFAIEDNGIGMEQKEADRLLKGETPSENIGRYAIRNVRDRLALRYGDDYDLKIESKPGMGTRVTVMIPASYEENGEKDASEKIPPSVDG